MSVRTELIWPALVAVTISVTTVTLFNILGVFLAKYPREAPILPRDGLRNFSRLVSNVCLPCLMFEQFGRSLSVERLQSAWYLAAFSVVNIAVAFCVGSVLRCIARPHERLHRGFLMALTFQNCLSLPLLLVEVLTRQPVIKDKIPDAYDQGYTFVFCYLVGNVPLLWTWCYGYIEADPRDKPKAIAAAATATATAAGRSLPSDAVAAEDEDVFPEAVDDASVCAAADAGCVAADARSCDGGVGDGGVSAIAVPEEEAPVVAAKSPLSGALPLPRAVCVRRWLWQCVSVRLRKAFCNPAFMTMGIAMGIALIGPLKHYVFFAKSTPLTPFISLIKILGTASVPMTTLIMGGTLGHAFWRRCTRARWRQVGRCCCGGARARAAASEGVELSGGGGANEASSEAGSGGGVCVGVRPEGPAGAAPELLHEGASSGAPQSGETGVILFTVTFRGNPSHHLTCSPYHL